MCVTIREHQVVRCEAYKQACRYDTASEHKVIIVWFDNVALPGNRSQHLTVLPDSLDAVVLQHPEAITAAIAAEAAAIPSKMGTRTLYSIPFAHLQAALEAHLSQSPADGA